jgi:hypothetical protein
MATTLFHCTFTERDVTGHVHPYAANSQSHVYAACLMQISGHEKKVTGGIIIQTDMHDTDAGFNDMLIEACQSCPYLLPLTQTPFTLQPFRTAILSIELPLPERSYYELLFEKYMHLAQHGSLAN